MSLGVWDWLMVQFRGEHIAVLGPRLSGKTTLYKFIADRADAREVTEQTLGPEPASAFRNADLGLTVRKGMDVPGAEFAHPDWERQFKTSSKLGFRSYRAAW